MKKNGPKTQKLACLLSNILRGGQGQKDREQGGHAYKGGALLRGCDYFWSYRGRMSVEISHLLVWYLSVRVPAEKR